MSEKQRPFNSVLAATGRTSELDEKLQRRLQLNGDVEEQQEDLRIPKLSVENVSAPTYQIVYPRQKMTSKQGPPPLMKSLALQSTKSTDANEPKATQWPTDIQASPCPDDEASPFFDEIQASPRPFLPIPESGIYGTVNSELEQLLTARLLVVEGEEGVARQLAQREQQKTQLEPMVMRMNGQRRRRSTAEDGSPTSDKPLDRLDPNSPMSVSSPLLEMPSPVPHIQGKSSALSVTSTVFMEDLEASEASDEDSSDEEQEPTKDLELEYDDCFDLLNHMPRDTALKLAQSVAGIRPGPEKRFREAFPQGVEEQVMVGDADQTQENDDALNDAIPDKEEVAVPKEFETNEEARVFFRGKRRHDQASAMAIERVGGTLAPPPEISATEALCQAYQLGTVRSVVQVGYASANSTYEYASYGASTTLQAMDTTMDYAGAALEVTSDQLSDLATTASDPLYQAAEKVGEVFTLSWTSDAWSSRASGAEQTLCSGMEVASQTASDVAQAASQTAVDAARALQGSFSFAWITQDAPEVDSPPEAVWAVAVA